MASDASMRAAGFGLRTGLLFLAITGAVMATFGTPEVIKQAASDSRIYTAVSELVSEQASEGSSDTTVRQALVVAAADSFTPSMLQSTGERVLDGTYRWLDGSTPQPDFTLDLTPAANTFMDSLSSQADDYARRLPVCRDDQLADVDPQSVSIFAIGCLPPGMSPETASELAINKARTSHPLLKEPVLTAASLKDGQGRPLHSALSGLPLAYQAMRVGFWILAAVCIVCAAALFIGHRTLGRATYHVARIAFWTGVIIVAVGGLAHVVFAIFTQPGTIITESMSGTFQGHVLSLLRGIEWSFSRTLLTYGGILLATGGIVSLAYRLASRDRSHYEPLIANASSAPTSVVTTDATFGEAVRPAPAEQPVVTPAPQPAPPQPALPAQQAPQSQPQTPAGAEVGRTIVPTDPATDSQVNQEPPASPQ